MSSYRLVGCVLAAAIGAASCNPEELDRVFPFIQVCSSTADTICEPPIDLGSLRVGQIYDVPIIVRNLGKAFLHIDDVEVVSGDTLEVLQAPTTIIAGEDASLVLRIGPAEGRQVTRLVILSDDAVQPRLEFDVIYEGVESLLVLCPTMGLDAEPDGCAVNLQVNAHDVRLAEVREIIVHARNLGNTDLFVEAATVADQSSVPGELSILTSTSSGFIPAGGEVPIVVRYTPHDAIDDELTLDVTYDADYLGSARLRVRAGLDDNVPPIASVVESQSGAADTTRIVGPVVWFDGSASFDPEGDPLISSWEVVASPEGSRVTLSHLDTMLTSIEPDLLGVYEVELTVTDSLGQTDSAVARLVVEPEHQLLITARWPAEQGDIDLHLVPEGDALFGPTDCFFGQPTVDYGEAGNGADDPSLVLDDEGHAEGHEVVRIERPAEGHYAVYINYFESRSSDATRVDISIEGDDGTALLGMATGIVANTCDTWKAGTIQWPGGLFISGMESIETVCFPGGQP